jgi:N-formylglutamate amidohydrolase
MSGSSRAQSDDHLVLAIPGRLPILITAPHGGSGGVPGVNSRTTGKLLRDDFTLELAQSLAKRLQELLGAPPYLVAAQFSRKYIDANRPAPVAYDTPQAKPFYDAYHHSIQRYVAQIKHTYPNGGLLIDIHGQSTDNDRVYRGTRQGSTVLHLIDRSGCAALTGSNSIVGGLAASGYLVHPVNAPTECLLEPEDARYVGGYTVATYGASHDEGIDAIQLEFGRNLRIRQKLADDLAQAVAVFYRHYLQE